MLSQGSLRLFVGAVSSITIGMFLGNLLFIYIGLVPIIYMLLGLAIQSPEAPEVSSLGETLTLWVDEDISVERPLILKGGLGPILVGETLPPEFELVEGSNIRLLWKGLRDLNSELSYKIRCTRRGVYAFDELDWESGHSLGLTSTELGSSEMDQTLLVRPQPFHIRRVRQQKTFSKFIMPSEAHIKMGIPTTEYKEIREYSFGDSYRHINWKATSRVASLGKPPMVNSYEMEGMKVVWIFLDTSSVMALGTNVKNGFEYGVQAVLGLAQFYLSRNCRVGFSLYDDSKPVMNLRRMGKTGGIRALPDLMPLSTSAEGAPGDLRVFETKDFLIPDSGKRQLHKINEKLLEAELLGGVYNLKQSIQRCRGHIIGTNPLFVVVTAIEERSVAKLMDGLGELRKYIKLSRKANPSALIVHVSGYGITAQGSDEEVASQIIELENRALLRSLKGRGAQVIHWDPSTQHFADVLLSQVGRR